MYGQYMRIMDRQLISKEDMFLLLRRGDLKAEAESEIIASQTKHHVTKILQTETERQIRTWSTI